MTMPHAAGANKRKAAADDAAWGQAPAAKRDAYQVLQASSAINSVMNGFAAAGRGSWSAEVRSPPPAAVGQQQQQQDGDLPAADVPPCQCGLPAAGATSKVRCCLGFGGKACEAFNRDRDRHTRMRSRRCSALTHAIHHHSPHMTAERCQPQPCVLRMQQAPGCCGPLPLLQVREAFCCMGAMPAWQLACGDPCGCMAHQTATSTRKHC